MFVTLPYAFQYALSTPLQTANLRFRSLGSSRKSKRAEKAVINVTINYFASNVGMYLRRQGALSGSEACIYSSRKVRARKGVTKTTMHYFVNCVGVYLKRQSIKYVDVYLRR